MSNNLAGNKSSAILFLKIILIMIVIDFLIDRILKFVGINGTKMSGSDFILAL
jgi:hypothetical protein